MNNVCKGTLQFVAIRTSDTISLVNSAIHLEYFRVLQRLARPVVSEVPRQTVAVFR